MIRTLDIAWLAGLLEGEGSFRMSRGSACIQMQSTDADVVRRAAELLGMKFRERPYKPRGGDHYKPVWGFAIWGTRAISWMMTLYVFLGERRQEKIRSILADWKACQSAPRGIQGQQRFAPCHPDRPLKSGGLCKACYMRAYRLRTGKNTSHYRKAV